VVGEAADGADAVAAAQAHRPDVVLMDIRMPGMDGIAATSALRRLATPPHVIVLTTFQADEHVMSALRAGADGFLLKDTAPRRSSTQCASWLQEKRCSHRRSPAHFSLTSATTK
jgi:DNA-binding NarL/FixJ family response regulator